MCEKINYNMDVAVRYIYFNSKMMLHSNQLGTTLKLMNYDYQRGNPNRKNTMKLFIENAKGS